MILIVEVAVTFSLRIFTSGDLTELSKYWWEMWIWSLCIQFVANLPQRSTKKRDMVISSVKACISISNDKKPTRDGRLQQRCKIDLSVADISAKMAFWLGRTGFVRGIRRCGMHHMEIMGKQWIACLELIAPQISSSSAVCRPGPPISELHLQRYSFVLKSVIISLLGTGAIFLLKGGIIS